MKKTVLICMLLTAVAIRSFSASPFRFVVATDGSGDYTSVQTAINACPDNERSIIFIKNGTYDEQVTLGSSTTASKKLISLIGESYGGVIITHNQYRASSGSPTYADVCTVKLYANDFYAENITIQNIATAGMAEALFTAGDRQTFKNCQVLGYQDAYRAKKGARCYFKNSLLQGAVDFIYAGGTVFFDDCTINCVKGGGYIVAPEDRYKYIAAASTTSGKDLNLEFIFRNCNITANADVADNTFTLGRPWNITSGAYYINCKLGPHIKAAGWTTMSGNETTASFGEYNSMDKSGNPLSTSGRISWSFQLTKDDAENLLTPVNVYAILSTTAYDPVSLCVSPAKPLVTTTNNTVSWTAVSDAIGYLLFKNGAYLASTTGLTFTDNSGITGIYSVKALNASGVLSDSASSLTDLSEIEDNSLNILKKTNEIIFDKILTTVELFSPNGTKVSQCDNTSRLSTTNLSKGAYILRVKTADGLILKKKLNI